MSSDNEVSFFSDMELVDIVQDLNAVEVYIVVHEACGNLIKWMIWAH